MIVLWILLALLFLILLALLIPVHACVRYGEELALDIKYLFFKIPVLPVTEKPEEPKPEQKPAGAKKSAPKEKKPNPLLEKVKSSFKAEGFKGFMDLVGRFVKLTGTTAVRIIKKLRLRDFDLYLMVGGEDAASAAILYGQICAAVYPAAEILFKLTKCRRRRMSIDLDYDVKEPYVKLEANVSVRPIFAVRYALQYLVGLLPLYQRFMNPVNRKSQKSEKERGQENERKQSQ